MSSATENLLLELGFPKPKVVEGRGSIADLHRKNRCGIYVLHFADGTYYVGQAVNVVRRYAQHRKTHLDIRKISFKRVGKRDLDIEEQAIVKRLEEDSFRLRNIQLVSFSYGETDFDLVMSPELQQAWLNDPASGFKEKQRTKDDELRMRYTRKYERFKSLPQANEITEVLRTYVQATIPAYKSCEMSFWMCSCLLNKGKKSTLLLRINIGFQATLEVHLNESGLYFTWFITSQLAKATFAHIDQPLRQHFRQLFAHFFQGEPFIEIGKSALIQGGQNQVYISAHGAESALKVLAKTELLYGFRKFNLGLMQKGPCPWGRNHCLDLADHLVG